MQRFLPALAACLVLATLTAAAAQSRTERVSFARGTSGTVISDTIFGYQAVDYVLGTAAGQRMVVTLDTDNASNYFNVTAPGAASAMFIGSTSGNRFDAVLPSGGDYRISVYLMRNAARRNEAASYSLSIQIVGGRPAAVAPPRPPDFADGNAGGPDFWQVWNVAPGDTLNLRAGPSGRDRILAQFFNGQVLRNFGCSNPGGQRWCQVQAPQGGPVGWVAGHFLRESGPPPQGGAGFMPPGGPGFVPVAPPGPDRTVKCSKTPQKCLSDAARICRGSYQVIDSGSHAGGLVNDAIPGPVTWYSMTYRCGPPDGREATFPFGGPSFRPPSIPGPGFGGPGVNARDMQRYCQGEAAAKFRQRPQNILTLPVEREPGGDRVVYGQFPPEGRWITTFICRFGADGRFLFVDRT